MLEVKSFVLRRLRQQGSESPSQSTHSKAYLSLLPQGPPCRPRHFLFGPHLPSFPCADPKASRSHARLYFCLWTRCSIHFSRRHSCLHCCHHSFFHQLIEIMTIVDMPTMMRISKNQSAQAVAFNSLMGKAFSQPMVLSKLLIVRLKSSMSACLVLTAICDSDFGAKSRRIHRKNEGPTQENHSKGICNRSLM